MITNTFTYNNGLLTGMVNEFMNRPVPGHRYDYSYTGGRLSEFRHSTIGEAGNQLVTTTGYTYKANGDLESITVTQTNNVKIQFSIDAWSEEFEIQPWLFITPVVSEFHHLYIYPVLSSLKRLPAEVTQSIIEPGQAARIEKVTETVYTINNKRLDKIVTKLIYPSHPELNKTQSGLFKY